MNTENKSSNNAACAEQMLWLIIITTIIIFNAFRLVCLMQANTAFFFSYPNTSCEESPWLLYVFILFFFLYISFRQITILVVAIGLQASSSKNKNTLRNNRTQHEISMCMPYILSYSSFQLASGYYKPIVISLAT